MNFISSLGALLGEAFDVIEPVRHSHGVPGYRLGALRFVVTGIKDGPVDKKGKPSLIKTGVWRDCSRYSGIGLAMLRKARGCGRPLGASCFD